MLKNSTIELTTIPRPQDGIRYEIVPTEGRLVLNVDFWGHVIYDVEGPFLEEFISQMGELLKEYEQKALVLDIDEGNHG